MRHRKWLCGAYGGESMRYAVSIPPFTDASRIVEMGRTAEQAGWDGVFLRDHVQWSAKVDPEVLDPWSLLGAIAQATEKVRLGTLVTPLSRRRPWVVAKQLTTLDHLSHGRAVLGVGLGAPADRDFSDLGDEADPKIRAGMLDESLQVIDQLMTGPTSFSGTYYQVTADFRPAPVQRPRPPVWVAGVAPNRRPLARARWRDGVVPEGPDGPLTPDDVSDYLALDGGGAPDGWDVV